MEKKQIEKAVTESKKIDKKKNNDFKKISKSCFFIDRQNFERQDHLIMFYYDIEIVLSKTEKALNRRRLEYFKRLDSNISLFVNMDKCHVLVFCKRKYSFLLPKRFKNRVAYFPLKGNKDGSYESFSEEGISSLLASKLF